MNAATDLDTAPRRIDYRTAGHGRGITRLMSPGDLGQLVKPFVFLDHFEADGRGFGTLPWHPHSGIATHTTLLDGEVSYEDSTGASGVLPQGGVEYMQAGAGVWHTGGAVPGRPVRGFQLWLALPDADELSPPQSYYVEPATLPVEDGVRLLLGTYADRVGPIPYGAPLSYLHVRLAAGRHWRYEPAAEHDVAWLAVSEGTLEVADATLGRELAVFEPGAQAIDLFARTDVELVIGSAARHPSPLVLGSYSVHSSDQRLREGQAGIRRVAAELPPHHPRVDFRG